MRLSECEIGDVVKCSRREMEYVGYDLNEYYMFRIITSTYISEPKNSIVRFSLDMDGITLISRNPQKSLETKIKEKELELETLKKELKEFNRNKMFENLDPNTIYKVVHDGFIEIGFMREFYRDSYRISNVFGKVGDMIPKECITEIIPLNEATETYKKLKNLLENA